MISTPPTIPKVGIGTITVGNRTRAGALASDEEDVAFLRAAFEEHLNELGRVHVDTAARYGDAPGRSEQLIGQARMGYLRQQLIIATKILPEHFGAGDFRRAVEASCSRLGVTPDIIYLHEPNPRIPILETLQAAQAAQAAGLFRAFGLSKFTGQLLKQVLQQTPIQVEFCQFRLSVGWQDYLRDGTVALCQNKGIQVVGYRPLLEGRVLTVGEPLLRPIANLHRITPAMVALRWAFGHEGVATIVGTTKIDHVREAVRSLECYLMDVEQELLTRSFPRIDVD